MYKFKVISFRVIDGDTVDVSIDLGFDVILANQRVRLYGIDAPESRTSDEEERPFGKLARMHVVNFFQSSADIFLISKEFKRGKFGRILGDFETVTSVNTLCEGLIANNLAVEYKGQSKDYIQAAHSMNRKILIESGKI